MLLLRNEVAHLPHGVIDGRGQVVIVGYWRSNRLMSLASESVKLLLGKTVIWVVRVGHGSSAWGIGLARGNDGVAEVVLKRNLP